MSRHDEPHVSSCSCGDCSLVPCRHRNHPDKCLECKIDVLGNEVQALRGQVQAALAYIEPRCVEEREVIQGYVTRDMATDAGEPTMEGEPVTGVETIEHEEWIELAAILRGVRSPKAQS